MSLRDAVLCAPNLAELNILDKGITQMVNQRRDEIIQYYIENGLEITFLVDTKVGKRKTKVAGRAKPKHISKEYISAIGTFPDKINGKKLRIPKVWVTDMTSEIKETGPADDETEPEENEDLDGVEWDS